MLKKIDKIVKYKGYIHLQSYDPDSVLAFVDQRSDPVETEVNGKILKVKVRSLRLQCFKRSKVCIECGLEGTVVSLDTFGSNSDRQGAHFNLYGEKDGKSRLMTKDHIMPKSKGGLDYMGNFQTMCDHCNNAKGDTLTEDEGKYIVAPNGSVAPFGDALNITIGSEK
jgi:hypothetical protein